MEDAGGEAIGSTAYLNLEPICQPGDDAGVQALIQVRRHGGCCSCIPDATSASQVDTRSTPLHPEGVEDLVHHGPCWCGTVISHFLIAS